MPVIILTGIPCSCKSSRCDQLKDFFITSGKEVHVVSEDDQIKRSNFNKNSLFMDANKEKQVRSFLKSEVLRLANATNVVILDGLNYIKGLLGYRYELYCGVKSSKITQCTLYTQIHNDTAWSFNVNRCETEDQWNREAFDALVMRYEEPDGKNRWDSPLFRCMPNDTLDFDSIVAALFLRAAPKPNASTQNVIVNTTNYLHDIDHSVKSVVDELSKIIQMGVKGSYRLHDTDINMSNITIPQLMMLRRQYLVYVKLHPPNADVAGKLFVQYLRNQLQQ